MVLFQVSETLTLDFGTLIFKNAAKNGTRGISVKFRFRKMIEILIKLREMENVFFWTQRCWRSILRINNDLVRIFLARNNSEHFSKIFCLYSSDEL